MNTGRSLISSHRSRRSRLPVRPLVQHALSLAIGEVDNQTDHQPNRQTGPGGGWQEDHLGQANGNAQSRNHWIPRYAESALQIWASPTQNDYAYTDDGEGQQSADRDQLTQNLYRKKTRD